MTSLIIPAHNAEGTIERTLASVKAQRRALWEVIVVDDGSMDGTSALVERAMSQDGRIRLVRQDQGGPSRARNVGLTLATGSCVTFLDADDTLSPDYLRRMWRRLDAAGGADGVCCGSERRGASGGLISRDRPGDLGAGLQSACSGGVPGPIHALMLRREQAIGLGGFDESLRAYEDWDLWIRMAAAGLRIASEPAVLVTYWSSPGSLTRDGAQMIRSHAAVVERTGLLSEADPADLSTRQDLLRLGGLIWSAGVAIGSGGAPHLPAHWVAPLTPAPDALDGLGAVILDGLAVGLAVPIRDVAGAWPKIAAPLFDFFAALGARPGAAGLDYRLLKALEKEVIRQARIRRRLALTRTVALPVTPQTFARPLVVEPLWDSVVFKIEPGRRCLEAPLFDTLDPAELRRLLLGQALHKAGRLPVLKRLRALRRLRWLDLRVRPLARRVRRRLQALRTRSGDQPQAPRPTPITAIPPPAQGRVRQVLDEAFASASERFQPLVREPERHAPEPFDEDLRGDQDSWDDFFEQPDPWGYDSPYEQLKYDRTIDLVPDRRIGRALELACAEGRFTERLAPRVERLRAVDISRTALERTAQRCARFGHVEYQAENFFEAELGSGWDLITCCEVLYYMTDEAQLDRFAARVGEALAPGGSLVQTHACVLVDDATRTGFDWAVPFGADRIAKAFEATPGLRRVRTLRTEIYRIDVFEKISDAPAAPLLEEHVPLATRLEPRVASAVVWHGPADVPDPEERAFQAPVLMYHRLAETGPPGLAPYRISPLDFERQLLFLRRRGFRSLSLDEWRANRLGASLAGRPVLITFDDAYVDFHRLAWPLLQRYGFSAHVFVPTDKVGRAADWDSAYGEPAPIMDWDEISDLANQGVGFGSHLASHPRADCLASEPLLREAASSRATLERVLDREVTSVAPPFGARNERVDAVLRLAGYRESFLDHGGPAQVLRLGLATPRIEVRGDRGLDVFAASLEMALPPPDAADEPPGPEMFAMGASGTGASTFGRSEAEAAC